VAESSRLVALGIGSIDVLKDDDHFFGGSRGSEVSRHYRTTSACSNKSTGDDMVGGESFGGGCAEVPTKRVARTDRAQFFAWGTWTGACQTFFASHGIPRHRASSHPR